MKCGIKVIPEYLPSELNVAAGWEFGLFRENSKSSRCSESLPIKEFSETDLFVSGLSYQMPTHVHVNQILAVM